MAQYKVPQDVEADDKLIGPFSFRQFVYLLIAAGLIALAVGLFQLFPLLAIIPVPFVFFFLALALPLKKDQPMETYLAALVSYYLKPRSRVWMPGQKESTILITAPKIVEDVRTRDISEEEATHRLSFLADIVDSEGYAIKGAGASPMREDLVAEANATPDMFETYQSQVLNRVIDQDKMSRHNSAVNEMKEAIKRNNNMNMIPDEPEAVGGERVIKRLNSPVATDASAALAKELDASNVPVLPQPVNIQQETGLTENAPKAPVVLKPDEALDSSDVVIRPEIDLKKTENPARGTAMLGASFDLGDDFESTENNSTKPVNDSIMELAHNTDFSVATIAKEANRINRKDKGEVFISLH